MTRHLGDLAAAFVDEELDARARARVLQHLTACGRCAADVEAQRQLKRRLRRLRPPALPGALAARLLEVPNARPPGHAPPAGGAAGEGVAGQGAAGLPVHVGTAGTPVTARPAAPLDRPPPR
ncbi:MAG: zf-HC2 domain-containing protein, partial [Frankiaceae bacterium]